MEMWRRRQSTKSYRAEGSPELPAPTANNPLEFREARQKLPPGLLDMKFFLWEPWQSFLFRSKRSTASLSSSRSNPLLHPLPRSGGGQRWGLNALNDLN